MVELACFLRFQVIPIAADTADAALESRAASLDDAWFERGLIEFAQHPSWPHNVVAAQHQIVK